MARANPKQAIRTLTFHVGGLHFDGLLHPYRSKGIQFTTVHLECRSKVEQKKPEKATPEEEGVSRVLSQYICPHCDNRVLFEDEIGKAYLEEGTLLPLGQRHLNALKFRPPKSAKAKIIAADDPYLNLAGTMPYAFVFPREGSIEAYARVWRALHDSGRVAFFKQFVMRSDSAFAAVLKPHYFPDEVMGQSFAALVLEEVGDLTQLKAPYQSQGFRDELARVDTDTLMALSKAMKQKTVALELEDTTDPREVKRRRVKNQLATEHQRAQKAAHKKAEEAEAKADKERQLSLTV